MRILEDEEKPLTPEEIEKQKREYEELQKKSKEEREKYLKSIEEKRKKSFEESKEQISNHITEKSFLREKRREMDFKRMPLHQQVLHGLYLQGIGVDTEMLGVEANTYLAQLTSLIQTVMAIQVMMSMPLVRPPRMSMAMMVYIPLL